MKQSIKQVFTVLMFTLLSLSAFAQRSGDEKILTGKVIDIFGEGIPGVNVLEKGTKKGTTTDITGKYVISVRKGAVLTFAYVGMVTVEKIVGSEAFIDLTMKDDTNELEQVVVVGYGTQKKGDLTSAIETIKMAEVEDLPTGSIAVAIAGRVLGVGVSGGSSRPGAAASISIRNPTTLSKDGGTTDPLYVIDGVLQVDATGAPDSTNFDNLDSSEVESLSFLKDASAAIYGSRSAQGVVLVTTKRGKKGPAKFTYTGLYGTEDESYRTTMLNAVEYANYYNIMNGINGNAAKNPTQLTKEYLFSQDEIDYFKTLNYDPLGDEWKPSYNQKHTMNVSGGNERATYFTGVSYYTQGGNLGSIDYGKYTFRSGADINVSENFKAGIQLAGNYTDISKNFSKVGGENEENDYRRLLNSSPFLPQYLNGLPVQRLNTSSESQYHYQEIYRLNNKTGSVATNMTVNLYAEYKLPFIKGLMVRGAYARSMGSSRGTQIGTTYKLYQFAGVGTNNHIYHNDSDVVLDASGQPLPNNTVSKINTYSNGDRLYYSNNNSLSEQTNLNISYNRNFGKSNVSGLFAIEKSEGRSSKEDLTHNSPLSNTNGEYNTAFGEVVGNGSGNLTGTLGYIGRVNYSFADKYLAEFLYRSDASTRFAPENYWGNFYSLSGGWIISKESFFKSKVIDYLKIRSSIGRLGKDDTKPWQWRQRFTYQSDKGAVFNGNDLIDTGLKMEATPNPDVTWSKELKTNFGVEAQFLNNRLSLTAESFYNIGTELLMSRTGVVPFTVGGSVASENYGKRDAWGYEFSAGWSDKIGSDFKYGININFGWDDNKLIVGDTNLIESILPWETKAGQKASETGKWGYDYMGMFKTQQDVTDYVTKYNITQVFGTAANLLRPGTLYYRDVRGYDATTNTFTAPDGIIDKYDQIQLSKRTSNKYGLSSNIKLAYKSFSINTVISTSFGGGWNSVDSQTRKVMKTKINDGIDNRPSVWNNIYDPELNPNGTMPNPYWSAINMDPESSFWQVSAFSLSIRNINAGYTLPAKQVNALGLSSVKLNFTALNPFIMFNPFDYKSPSGAYDIYPELKTYSLGLNVSF